MDRSGGRTGGRSGRGSGRREGAAGASWLRMVDVADDQSKIINDVVSARSPCKTRLPASPMPAIASAVILPPSRVLHPSSTALSCLRSLLVRSSLRRAPAPCSGTHTWARVRLVQLTQACFVDSNAPAHFGKAEHQLSTTAVGPSADLPQRRGHTSRHPQGYSFPSRCSSSPDSAVLLLVLAARCCKCIDLTCPPPPSSSLFTCDRSSAVCSVASA